MTLSLYYIPCRSIDEARQMARHLLKERRIVCANILPQMQSLYLWEGAIEEAHEVVLILKTSKSQAVGLMERIQQLHSYEVPCVLELNVARGNPAFLQWMEGALKRSTDDDDPPPWD